MTMESMTVEPTELAIEMTGRFDVTLAPGGDESTRCGPVGSPRNLAYKVVIHSSPEFLDEQGFIVDWQDVKMWFETAFTARLVFPSCERIACEACTYIVGLLHGRVHRVEVTIGSGATPAGMKSIWRSGGRVACGCMG